MQPCWHLSSSHDDEKAPTSEVEESLDLLFSLLCMHEIFFSESSESTRGARCRGNPLSISKGEIWSCISCPWGSWRVSLLSRAFRYTTWLLRSKIEPKYWTNVITVLLCTYSPEAAFISVKKFYNERTDLDVYHLRLFRRLKILKWPKNIQNCLAWKSQN